MRIGIAISGGGYRATTYSLGTFSYLNQIKFTPKTSLLDYVEALSTVSGGSITGITYSLAVKRQHSFEKYFNDLYTFITQYDLVSESIKNFVDPNTKKSLIEGFAKTYNDILFVGENGIKENKIYTIEDIISESHIKYNCINATDFNTGNSFRFIAKSESFKSKIISGNFFYRLDKFINKIPLSTALAASSCFPGGFEPILLDLKKYDPTLKIKLAIEFEKEFLEHPELYPDKKNALEQYIERHSVVSLMDGGIVDNQGIKSLLNYENSISKNGKIKGLDLMMVVDVSSPSFTPFEEKRHTHIPIIGNIKMINILIVIFILNVLSIGALTCSILKNNIDAVFVSTLCFTLFTLLTTLLITGRRVVKKLILNNGFDFGEIKKMNILTPNTLLQLGINRFKSVNILVGNVFMKHLRRLNIAEFFSDLKYRKKAIHNAIYQLKIPTKADKNVRMSFLNFPTDDKYKKYIPSDEIAVICTHAFQMGTTLWVSKDDEGKQIIQNVLIAGQITTCANLFLHYDRMNFNDLSEDEKFILDQTKEHLLLFNKNPYWMLEELLGKEKIIKPTK